MNTLAMAWLFGSPETIILIIIGGLILFGGKKIPELMKGMGQGVKEFKKGLEEGASEDLEKKDDEKKDEKN